MIFVKLVEIDEIFELKEVQYRIKEVSSPEVSSEEP